VGEVVHPLVATGGRKVAARLIVFPERVVPVVPVVAGRLAQQVPGHQGGARDGSRHQEDGDEGHQEREGQRDAEAEHGRPASAQQPEALLELDAPALERDGRQLLGEEEAGDAEAEGGDDGLADHRDEPAGEEQDAEERDPHQDPQAVPGRDPQLAPERQPRLGHLAALAAVDRLREGLVEGLSNRIQ
jgi:hypothetical protein